MTTARPLIKLSKNPVLHGRSKYIDVKYYFLSDLDNDGTIDLKISWPILYSLNL